MEKEITETLYFETEVGEVKIDISNNQQGFFFRLRTANQSSEWVGYRAPATLKLTDGRWLVANTHYDETLAPAFTPMIVTTTAKRVFEVENKDNLLANKTGKVTVLAKLAHGDNNEGTGPNWQAEQSYTLEIIRREKTLPNAKRKSQIAGNIVVMEVTSIGWADYDEDDFCGDNLWLCENYYMDIIKVLD